MPAKLTEVPLPNSDASKTGAGLSRGPNLRKKLVASAWSQTWPAPGATLDLDFVNNRGFVFGQGQGGVMDAINFTRASSATYIGSDGLLATAGTNTSRFDWDSNPVSITKNLLTYTEDLSNPLWVKESCTVVDQTSGVWKIVEKVGSPVNGFYGHDVYYNSSIIPASSSRVLTIEAKSAERSRISIHGRSATTWGWSTVDLTTGATVAGNTGGNIDVTINSVVALTGGWWRITATVTMVWSLASGTFTLSPNLDGGGNSGINYSGDGTSGVLVRYPQVEVSPATTYKAVGNVIPVNKVLAASSTVNGILIEEQRTNLALWCRDATQSAWAKTNTTAALTQTGIDGVANSATSLTATVANATCIQSTTATSTAKTVSVYLKAITVTGNIQVSMDGSTWSTVDLSNGQWNRISLTATLANPVVGILIQNSGDAVAMDYAQMEAASFATTPIFTTSATATRALDTAYVKAFGYNTYKSTFYVSSTRFGTAAGGDIAGPLTVTLNNGYYSTSSRIGMMCDRGAYLSWALMSWGESGQTDSRFFGLSTPTAYTPYKIAFTYDNYYASAATNYSSTPVTLNSVIYNSPQNISLNIGGTASYFVITYSGYINRVIYFPKTSTTDQINDLMKAV